MLRVGRLIKDSPVRWAAAYKVTKGAFVGTTRQRFNEEFLGKTIPIPTPRREGTNIRVLSIGSGSGEADSVILRKIMQSQTSVYSRVVEPSGEMLQDFKAMVQQDTSLGAVKFNWRQQTAEEYFSDYDGTKFDLAHAVRVLYHVEDHHAALRNMWEQLADGGYLFVLLLSDKRGVGKLHHEMWKWFPHENDRLQTSLRTSSDVTRSLESMGISYVIAEDEHDVNLAECYKEDSETGRLLLDFLTQTSNVYEYPKMRSAVLEYCLRNSSLVDDKIVFKVRTAAIIARKNEKNM
ncbi:PREDICTED: histamine N-methyltransferase-like [Branchiostoma belcheri]|uniref:Histamine N-methyltransferase-like n=1 Tax=Branchiostoma belcheri TaxID=7741 RepID=A0A6P4ZC81_BRABE|nr:PREDICTED: histamine N-methyltransferase-like [Branchiostoma belcheri]